MIKKSGLRAALAVAGLGILGGAGCGGADSSTLWLVTGVAGMRPASCYVGGMLPMPTRTDVTTGTQSVLGPWEFYEGAVIDGKPKYFLTMGSNTTVYEGTMTDGVYRFEWVRTVTDKRDIAPKRTTTDTYTNVLSFRADNKYLDGKWEVRETHVCSGECMDVLPNCSTESKVSGRQVEREKFQVYSPGNPTP